MQLEKNLWLAGGYYIDFDELGQLRIIGPSNHLYCGLVDIPLHKIEINKVEEKNNILEIKGCFLDSRLNLYYPAMDDIRTVREITEDGKTFLFIRSQEFNRLIPQIVKFYQRNKKKNLLFKRVYQENLYYQTSFGFPTSIRIKKINKPYKGFQLSTKGEKIDFTIKAETNDIHYKDIKNFFLIEEKDFNFEIFKKYAESIKHFWKRTEEEIKHLIRGGKTSGDRFGTVFPRDWMESADLGIHDLREEVRSYMYKTSLKNISRKGEGWHEDLVGEYKYEHEIVGRDIFDRHMIDIEPHYLIGLKYLPQDFLVDRENRQKLQRVAKYIINQSRKNDFIIFKKLPLSLQTKEEKYYSTGNWRDSKWAFKKIHPIIAPFDVNVVFYPEALKTIKKFQKKLGLKVEDIDKLIKKWEGKKRDFLFKNPDGRLAYALAIYDFKKQGKKLRYKKMTVNHLDEAYLFAYRRGDEKEIKSFCQRLLDPKYFYTPAGPLITAKNNQLGYTTGEYHGLVIWTKQVAFTILALSKHLKIAVSEDWPKDLQSLIKKTILLTSKNMIEAFAHLKAIPEVHWDDQGTPRLFSEQLSTRGQMSKIQLWSAIGARRIFRKYYEIITDPAYKAI